MTHQILVNDLQELEEKAKDFVKLIGNQKQFAFYGEMGVGKTTFIS